MVKKQGGIGQGTGYVAPQLVGKGYLWCKQHNAFASVQTGLGKLKIHGCFTAAGYAKQQARGRRICVQGSQHALERRVLVLVEAEGGRRRRQQALLCGINHVVVQPALAREVDVPSLEQGVQGWSNGLTQ